MIAVTNATFNLSHCFSFRIAATHVVSGLAPLVLSHNSKEYNPDHPRYRMADHVLPAWSVALHYPNAPPRQNEPGDRSLAEETINFIAL